MAECSVHDAARRSMVARCVILLCRCQARSTLVAVAEGPLASHKVDERGFNAAGLPLTRQR
jgi:hypothetical protein